MLHTESRTSGKLQQLSVAGVHENAHIKQERGVSHTLVAVNPIFPGHPPSAQPSAELQAEHAAAYVCVWTGELS